MGTNIYMYPFGYNDIISPGLQVNYCFEVYAWAVWHGDKTVWVVHERICPEWIPGHFPNKSTPAVIMCLIIKRGNETATLLFPQKIRIPDYCPELIL